MATDLWSHLCVIGKELGKTDTDLEPLFQQLQNHWYSDVASLADITCEDMVNLMNFPLRLAKRLKQDLPAPPCFALKLSHVESFLIGILIGPRSAVHLALTCRRLFAVAPMESHRLSNIFLSAVPKASPAKAGCVGLNVGDTIKVKDCRTGALKIACVVSPATLKVKCGWQEYRQVRWANIVSICWKHFERDGTVCMWEREWQDLPRHMPELDEDLAIGLVCYDDLHEQLLCAAVRAEKKHFLKELLFRLKSDHFAADQTEHLHLLGRVLLAMTEMGKVRRDSECCHLLAQEGAIVSERDAVHVMWDGRESIFSRYYIHSFGHPCSSRRFHSLETDSPMHGRFCLRTDSSGAYLGPDILIYPPKPRSNLNEELDDEWVLADDGGYDEIYYCKSATITPPVQGWKVTESHLESEEENLADDEVKARLSYPRISSVLARMLVDLPQVSNAKPPCDVFAPQGLAEGPRRVGASASDEVLLQEDDADVEIGRAFSACGKDLSIEEVFQQMRMALKGHGMLSGCVKIEESTNGETVTMPVDALRFTQRSCSSRFSCGKRLEDTIKELSESTVDPLQHANFVLRVVRRNGRFYSIDNRRLYCMKEAQRRIRSISPAKLVWAKVLLYLWDPVLDNS